jgi:hypothetical protein
MKTLVALLFVAVVPSVAHAGVCNLPSPGGGIVPAMGDVDVPLNAKIWLPKINLAGALTLTDAQGNSIALSSAELKGASVAYDVLTPSTPLTPSTTYTFTHETLTTQFTTGTVADTIAPALPQETDRNKTHVDATSGEDHHGAYDLVTVDITHEPGIAVIDIGGTTTLDAATASGLVATTGAANEFTLGDASLDCGEDNWNGASSTIRYGTFDVAGNFSGWTTPTTLTMPGCSMSGTDGASLGAIFMILVAIALSGRGRTSGAVRG